jgi:acyl carrier protein
VGVPGELCIGGAGVARGYLGPTSQADRFVTDPFTGGRMYRTGDLCRFLPDGGIQFLGRRDHQVKVRGHRIDLAHVESILNAAPGVLNAAVVTHRGEEGDERLLAMVSPAPDAQLHPQRLRDYARERLAPALRPSGYVLLDALPLTVSGKIDRKRLPAPRPGDIMVDSRGRPPQGAAEEALAALFCEVLGLTSLGAADDFFADLGGNSLLATQLVSRIRRAMSVELPLRDFFQAPSVEQLATAIAGPAASHTTAAGPIARQPRDHGRHPVQGAPAP